MKTFLVKLKPIEPYFFGNEKKLAFPDSQSSGSYFIKGEYIPSQSTVLGMLRFMLMPVRKSDWNYSEEDKKINGEAIGYSGFHPNQNNSFGKILDITPVFLTGPSGKYIVTPFDHKEGESTYTPFRNYKKIKTVDGERYFAEEYNSKDGITSSYMALSDGSIISNNELFTSVVRTGINRDNKKSGYFKREYKILNDDFSFAVYLTLDDGIVPHDEVVFAGQGKSAFHVSFHEEENCIHKKLSSYLSSDVVYCFGDMFADRTLYNKCLFAITKTKTYRAFQKNKNRVEKGSELHRLITAGSIFIPADKEEFVRLCDNEKFSRIGYNKLIAK